MWERIRDHDLLQKQKELDEKSLKILTALLVFGNIALILYNNFRGLRKMYFDNFLQPLLSIDECKYKGKMQ
jgi:hypothetical protein